MLRILQPLLLGLVFASMASAREWTDSTGKFSVEAEYVALTDDAITLKKRSGETISLSLSRLSEPDQKYARFLASEGEILLEKIVDDDPVVRRNAAKNLVNLDPPPEAVDPILDFIRKEAGGLSPAGIKANERRPLDAIPFVGDEISLVRLKADPQRYIGETLTLLGVASPSTYYNYGYINAESTHYSLRLVEPDAEGVGRESAHLYVPRTFSDLLVQKVVSATESSSASGMLLRVFVKLDADRYDGASTYDLLEVIDWQFFNYARGAWDPPALEGLAVGLACLASVKDKDALIDVIKGQGVQTSSAADLYVRKLASDVLDKIDPQEIATQDLLDILTDANTYGNEETDEYIRNAVGDTLVKLTPSREEVDNLVDVIASPEDHVSSTIDPLIRRSAAMALANATSALQSYAERRLKNANNRARREDDRNVFRWTAQTIKLLRKGS